MDLSSRQLLGPDLKCVDCARFLKEKEGEEAKDFELENCLFSIIARFLTKKGKGFLCG
jgi:hypothetical protein